MPGRWCRLRVTVAVCGLCQCAVTVALFVYLRSTGHEIRWWTQPSGLHVKLLISFECMLKRMSSIHSYVAVAGAICALSLCDRSYPRKGAFAYLDDIANEFLNQYATKVSCSVFGSIEYRFELAEHYGMWMLLKVKCQLTDSFAGRRCQ